MAQEIQVLTWCDLEHGERQRARTYTISIAGPGETPIAYDVDLCESCEKSYLDLRAEAVEHGRAQQSGKTRRAPVATGAVHPEKSCPADGCEYTTTTATGLTAHVKSVHGLTVAELTGDAHLPCPSPGCGRKFGAVQGLSVHVRNAHPEDWPAFQARQAVAS